MRGFSLASYLMETEFNRKTIISQSKMGDSCWEEHQPAFAEGNFQKRARDGKAALSEAWFPLLIQGARGPRAQ